jgi:hypothetical protein
MNGSLDLAIDRGDSPNIDELSFLMLPFLGRKLHSIHTPKILKPIERGHLKVSSLRP